MGVRGVRGGSQGGPGGGEILHPPRGDPPKMGGFPAENARPAAEMGYNLYRLNPPIRGGITTHPRIKKWSI